MRAYKKSAVFAMLCGAATCALGASCLFLSGEHAALAAVVTAAVFVNAVVHAESFYGSLREGRRQENVFTITFVEFAFVCFGLQQRYVCAEGGEEAWRCFLVVFAFYLTVNGASLAALPLRSARVCGVFALLTALMLYGSVYLAKTERTCALLLALCLAVNGAERVYMSARGGKNER